MRIVVAGGTGFIGRALVGELVRDGHDAVVLTRRATVGEGTDPGVPGAARFPNPGADVDGLIPKVGTVHMVQWDPQTDVPVEAVEGTDAVVNLAGATLTSRWTDRGKDLIVSSRVSAARALVKALQAAATPPEIFVSASAVGYYGPCGDELITEGSPAGNDFLANVCRRWEVEAKKAAAMRVVLTRTGLVLGDGGALGTMMLPFRLCLGGPLGSGRQWMPWIHMDDVVGLIRFAIENETVRGPLNVVGPEPVRNQAFARALGRVMRRPSIMPVPACALRSVLGEMADVVLTGQRAVPEKALAAGYRFRHVDAEAALRAVLARSRR